MINMSTIEKYWLALLLVLVAVNANAQFKSTDIHLETEESSNKRLVVVKKIKNKSSSDVRIKFINEYATQNIRTLDISPGEERTDLNITCNIVEAKPKGGDNSIFLINIPKINEPTVSAASKDKTETKEKEEKTVLKEKQEKTDIQRKIEIPVEYDAKKTSKKGILSTEDVVADFNNFLESIPFLSFATIDEEASDIEDHINSMRNWKDKDAYVREHYLNSYINSIRDSIIQFNRNTTSLITGYLENLGKKEIYNRTECIDSIQAILTYRLNKREENINRLENEINTSSKRNFDWVDLNGKLIGVCAGLIVLLLFLFVWFKKANKKNKTRTTSYNASKSKENASTAIVIRRKTTSILRKQSLEDVIGNDAYLKIDCNEFCNDSAVRRIYIKNTCIKDIYNMYADDLRNPNKPNEDGCMVLGRWVHDAEANEYYVSLEHIVLPGDDAVFGEYELNFGGKIKLKYTEKLRKLRRETNLQYDLTCWVHSHPGLGVFFSNSDCNVQKQLKNPTHPNFLTAIVVDILTPKQEFGIFTFKRDSSINSKADLKKMYSLEDLYMWAVESERNSFNPDDYFNTLELAKSHYRDCAGIELSNGAVIDVGKFAAEERAGFVGFVHGFSNLQGLNTNNIAVTISKNAAVPDNELIGCFVMAIHRSLPSIRKAIASYVGNIKFVLVYTSTDGLLTSIPVVNHDICTDENYYGEHKLEDLKIWTRRKR